jgi:hypothetical protein
MFISCLIIIIIMLMLMLFIIFITIDHWFINGKLEYLDATQLLNI